LVLEGHVGVLSRSPASPPPARHPDETAPARIPAPGGDLLALDNRPVRFDPAEIARAGVFVSLNRDGRPDIARGYVRPEDEARADQDEETPSTTGPSLDTS
jgi:hypothetical protein